jgi:hypothetical protein
MKRLILAAMVVALVLTSRTEIKGDVVIRRILPPMELVLRTVRQVFSEHGYPAIISEYYRPGGGGKHPEDLAIDYRVKHVASELWKTIGMDISIRLGAAYDVILELDDEPDADLNRSHIHIEYDPQPWKNARSYHFITQNITTIA